MRKDKLKKSIWVNLIAGFVPTVFCVVSWAFIGIYPGSSRTLLSTDLQYEFYGFYQSLRQVISGDDSLFYNWSLFMGYNVWGNIATYYSSPISWMILLWDVKDFATAFYFLTLVKIFLCGLFFSIFLVNRPIYTYNKYDNKLVKNFAIIAFSTCYALMSYNMKYLINSMWLDTVYMLPLVLLGIERIVALRKCKFFYISAVLMIFVNYYTAFMAAIFSIFYFVYYIFYYFSYIRENCVSTGGSVDGKVVGKAIIQYIYSGLCAVGTSLVILMPTLYCLLQGKIDDDTNVTSGITTFPFWKILKSFFYSGYDSITNDGTPPVFCTSFCIIFSALFIVMSLKKRAKIVASIISLFWIVTLWITPFNRVWTGFRDPVWYPFRYAFVISCFFIVLGYEGCICFFACKFRYKKPVVSVYLGLSLLELFLCINNQRMGIIGDTSDALQSSVELAYEKYTPLIEEAGLWDDVVGDCTGFYRLEKDDYFTFNDGMVYSYKGIQSFSSVFSKKQLDYFKRIGLKQHNYVSYEIGNTVIGDSIIGIKYFCTGKNQVEYYNDIAINKQIKLYVNPYALSLGYIIDDDAGHVDWSVSPMENQNAIISSMLGMNTQLFTNLEFDENTIAYDETYPMLISNSETYIQSEPNEVENRIVTFTADRDGHIYLYTCFEKLNNDGVNINSIYKESKQVYLNGVLVADYKTGEYSYLTDLGYYSEGDTATIIVTNCSAGTELYLSTLDKDKVIESLEKLGQNSQMTNIEIKRGNVFAEIDADKAGLMFMSIPYDKGWTLWIDGEKTEIVEAFDTFSSCKISAGKHTIVMKYVSPLFVEGVIASVISLMIYICIQIYEYKSMLNKSKKVKNA